jgi:glycosyltransferase involved in cell wall biosynthesis
MGCQTSVIITAFQRPHLLKWGLYSLARQTIPFNFEIIVVNDAVEDETVEICRMYQQQLNIKYIFSGHRNHSGEIKWRVPGFAINIGVRHAEGEVLIISCAEMFHLNDTISQLTGPVHANRKLIGVPHGKDDQNGAFLNSIETNNGNYDYSLYEGCAPLNVYLPFLMSVSRREFFEIGGYDEDYTGIAYDDNDFVERLRGNGCVYHQTGAYTVHLYHPRYVYGKEEHPALLFNQNLYHVRKGVILRNENREWGKL